MSAKGWLHPLSRASHTLTARLMALEERPEKERDQAWWDEYVKTTDVLVRCMQHIAGPAPRITTRDIDRAFSRQASGNR